MRERLRRGDVLFAVAALIVLLAIWAPVLLGHRVMIGGDVLYEYLPWSTDPGAHLPANTLMSDPAVEGLVWCLSWPTISRASFRRSRGSR